jgi:hypothetical protein
MNDGWAGRNLRIRRGSYGSEACVSTRERTSFCHVWDVPSRPTRVYSAKRCPAYPRFPPTRDAIPYGHFDQQLEERLGEHIGDRRVPCGTMNNILFTRARVCLSLHHA